MSDATVSYQKSPKQEIKKPADVARTTAIFGKKEAQNSSLFKKIFNNLEGKDGFNGGANSKNRSSSSQERTTFSPQQRSHDGQQQNSNSWTGSTSSSSSPSSNSSWAMPQYQSFAPTQQQTFSQENQSSSSSSKERREKTPSSNSHKVSGEHQKTLSKGQANTVAKAKETSSSKERIAIIEKLSSRILMAQGKDGSTTMRLTLSKNLLPGVALEISQGQGGSTNLSFISSVASSLEFLSRFQKEIEQRVAQNTGTSVHVSLSGEGGEGGNNAQQRSRGWIDPQSMDPFAL